MEYSQNAILVQHGAGCRDTIHVRWKTFDRKLTWTLYTEFYQNQSSCKETRQNILTYLYWHPVLGHGVYVSCCGTADALTLCTVNAIFMYKIMSVFHLNHQHLVLAG